MNAEVAAREQVSDVHAPWLSPESFWVSERVVESAWLGHAPFAYWVVAAHRPRRIVELGTHNGFSYFTFCEAVRRLGLDAELFAIDSWQGDDQAGYYGEAIYEGVVAANAPYAERSTLLRGYFADHVDAFADGSIDLLHIDGRHGYEDVKEDFELYLPKLSDRGLVLFHDIAEHQEGFGVWQFWDEIRTAHPSFTFEHSHGLGVLAVGADQTEQLRAFLAVEDTDRVRADYERLGAIVEGVRGLQIEAGEYQATVVHARNLQAIADHAQAELDRMRNSAAWRVTAPLRAARRVLAGRR